MKNKTTVLTLFALAFILMPLKTAQALEYERCSPARTTSACFITMQKLIRMNNPITKEPYFSDNYHSLNGKLANYPEIDVAETDLDGDGFEEIIAVVTEADVLTEGLFCKNGWDCPHYIFQDRNVDPQKLSLRKVKTFGPIFSHGIGLSTDEIVNGFKSLRVYRDINYTKFDVYQYDKKSDDYFNISIPE